ncbi:MAG: cation:proton antiporter, partial [Coprobacter sp.]
SVSYNTEFDKLPSFLSKYFAGNNIVVLYPEQFGKESQLSFFSDPRSMDVQRDYTRFIGLRLFLENLLKKKKRWGHRNQKKDK